LNVFPPKTFPSLLLFYFFIFALLQVPKTKIMVGLPLYAHTWFVPGLEGTAWQSFGLNATVQGECCGPFKGTFGAKPGQGCSLCGSMMWSEIQVGRKEKSGAGKEGGRFSHS
jgi:hypothetical protein